MSESHREGDWRDGFLFVGNQLALDLLNTVPKIDGQLKEFLPDLAALLRWFVAAELIEAKRAAGLLREWRESRGAARMVETVREFREHLRREVLALEAGRSVQRKSIEELDVLLAEHPMRRRILLNGGTPTMERWFPVERPEDLLAPLADAAARLFTDADPERIRKCGKCVLHFLDTSKKGNRHWCSMQICGNREKVAAYAARQRGE